MSQWVEIRQMCLVEGVPKKEVARRLGVNVKTVRRALENAEAPVKRHSPTRGRRLDPFRGRIVALLKAEPRITAKRIGRLLQKETGPIGARTVREYVAQLREVHLRKEAFVHRSHRPGQTMEVDFGESRAWIGGYLQVVKFLVATLPASNAYFAKAYPVERLECLMDGITEAFLWFGGLTDRLVLDNTSLAVRQVLSGPDRIENKRFAAFRGSFPFAADYCAPAKGWEKGSVEKGVSYVRANCFRPMPECDSFDDLNRAILEELENDLSLRSVSGVTVAEALAAERDQLRPLPEFMPDCCRTLAVIADKYGNVRVDRNSYSLPSQFARRSVIAKLHHDRIDLAIKDEVITSHKRLFGSGELQLDPFHVLPLLEKKHRAAPESTALRNWQLPSVFEQLRQALHARTRKANREWVKVLRLAEQYQLEAVEEAVCKALASGSPRLATIRMLLRQSGESYTSVEPISVSDFELANVQVEEPDLEAYDLIQEVA